MWRRAREAAAGAFRDFAASWRPMAIADIANKTLAFAILTPATALVLRWLLSRSGASAVADADIVRFFLTTPAGVIAFLFGGALTIAVAIFETACLMAIGVERLDATGAIAFAARRAGKIFRLAGHMLVRAIAVAVPFLGAIAIVYAVLLREHDINYYLSRKPPEFLIAAALVAMVGIAFAVVAIVVITRWALSMPLVLFEDVSPRSALRESASRSSALVTIVLAGWAIGALALSAFSGWVVHAFVRAAAAWFAGSAAAMIAFLAFALILWAAATLAVTIVNASLFALLLVRLWNRESRIPDRESRISTPAIRWSIAAACVVAASGFALLAFQVTRHNQPVLVIAHRGASKEAPENSLASFRKAVAQHADFVELDVQESRDGEVLVVHDSDLMKAGGSPMKIWEHTAAELRTVDIGRGERVPTLAEALAVCKGTPSRMLIELKSYGHDQELERRVVDTVERAGMSDACAFMSLDHTMVRTLKTLRPDWRVGLLLTKSVGDPTTFGADFLAVEVRALTVRLVRRAHRAQQDVYVWTVDDPAWMLAAASRGTDGLITNKPAVARELIARRASMNDAQRLLAAMLVRSGARTEALESENALRP